MFDAVSRKGRQDIELSDQSQPERQTLPQPISGLSATRRGQKAKYSLRADVVRFTPGSRHPEDVAECPKSAAATLEMREAIKPKDALFVCTPSSEQKSAPLLGARILLDIGQVDGVTFHE
jgi:hypothetical protein